ncbi:response regulator [Actinomadura terrae]|uniref:response regulator n=1 Tax=Actinomadura terrae TaxID=604353 RepID=UPI001FA7A3EE|nr:response regulator transcription factor [Actinomadura terrae]
MDTVHTAETAARTEGAAPVRVLLVDDEWLVRAGLRTMLTGAEGIEVVGEAADGTLVREQARETGADVVLMDIRMPRTDGLTATRQVRAGDDPPEVIVLTTFDQDDLVLNALRGGAAGFLLKTTPPGRIVEAIRAVAAGEPAFSPRIVRTLVNHVTDDRHQRRLAALRRLDQLTPTERQMADAVALGLSNAQIAERLVVSVATVKSYVSRLLAKLDLENRVQIALLVHDAE